MTEQTPAIYFRCDAGSEFGLGHMMRCVALAQQFRKNGCKNIVFLTRKTADDFLYNELLKKNDFDYTFLPQEAKGLNFDIYEYADSKKFNIVVFDNYDVTGAQMLAFKRKYNNLVAIDDLADRTMAADIVINQNINAGRMKYKLVGRTRLLLGTRYVMLRDAYLQSKQSRRKQKTKKTVCAFISFGGSKVFSKIEPILNAFKSFDQVLSHPVNVLFAMPAETNEARMIVEKFSGCRNIHLDIITDSYDLVEYQKEADFAVTAAGSSVFELAYLGVPQLAVIISGNQEVTGLEIEKRGIGICLGRWNALSQKRVIESIEEFIFNESMKRKMATAGSNYIDGNGTERIVKEIAEFYNFKLKPATSANINSGI